MSGPAPHVLVLTPDFPPAHGGIQVLVHRVASNWTRLVPRVATLAHEQGPSFDREQHFQVLRVRVPPGVRGLAAARLNAFALRVALVTRPRAVLSAHIVTSPAASAIARATGAPYVQYFYAKEVGAKRRLARFAAANAAANVVISRYTESLVNGLGLDGLKVRRIPTGVDLDILPEVDGSSGAGRPTLLTIARLEDRYKGHDVVLRALPLIRARVPDVQWVVIGDGPLRAGLEGLATAQGVADSVRFLGRVSDAERDHWLRRADVFTMPSRLPAGGFAGEGFGIVYLEASGCGLPVVAGNVGGAIDAVADGESGLLVDPTDHVAVAEAIAGLLGDPQRAAALGRKGRDRAQRFGWPGVSRAVEDLLLEVIGQ